MTAIGPNVAIPPEVIRLQPHIKVVIKAIKLLMQDQFNISLSKPLLSLMRHFLTNKAIHFISVNKSNKLRKYYDSDDANLPLISLVMTFKFFFMYLKKKAKDHSDIINVFKTDFHFFAPFVCASLLADKLTYEKLSPEIIDTRNVFQILHENIIKHIQLIVAGESTIEWWDENRIPCIRMFEDLAQYSPFEDTHADTIVAIRSQLPADALVEFEELFEKLGILTRFMHYSDDSDISDEDNFYNNSHDDNFSFISCNSADEYDPNDYEEVFEITDIIPSETSSNSLSASYEGSTCSDSTPRKAIFNLCLYEKAFLQTLDYRYNLTFTLTQANQLLICAKQFVSDPDSNVDSFIEKLNTFGQLQPEVAFAPALRFSRFEHDRSTARARSSEPCEEKANLRRISY
ncbi:MAG: hypothetical protein AB7I18_13390 [Candidatus Berkiella sp.]